MPISKDSEATLAAFHEAGHCVMATMLGVRHGRARIFDDGRGGAKVYAYPYNTPPAARLLISLSGAIGESFVGLGPCDGDAGDQFKQQLIIDDFSIDEREVAGLRWIANRLLVTHRRDVEAVADALLERGRLSASDIDALL